MARTMVQTWTNYYEYLANRNNEEDPVKEDFIMLKKQISQVYDKLEGMRSYLQNSENEDITFYEDVKTYISDISPKVSKQEL